MTATTSVVGETPWLHHLPTLHQCLRGRRYNGTRLSIRGPLPPGHFIRSVHTNLPRCIPSFSSRIRLLILTEIRFRHVADLAHLLQELADLRELTGTGLSWAASSTSTPPLRRLRTLEKVKLEGGGKDWVAAWLVGDRTLATAVSRFGAFTGLFAPGGKTRSVSAQYSDISHHYEDNQSTYSIAPPPFLTELE